MLFRRGPIVTTRAYVEARNEDRFGLVQDVGVWQNAMQDERAC
jgi:hypothetical protein